MDDRQIDGWMDIWIKTEKRRGLERREEKRGVSVREGEDMMRERGRRKFRE